MIVNIELELKLSWPALRLSLIPYLEELRKIRRKLVEATFATN
jgi:hypothetical protein